MTEVEVTLLQTPSASTYIHATAVAIGEVGLVFRGPSRAGKSSLALDLLERACAKLIGDDRVGVERVGATLLLRGHPLILGRIEKRGEGILDAAWEPQSIAHYVFDLEEDVGRGTPRSGTTQILGLELPLHILPRNIDRAGWILDLLKR